MASKNPYSLKRIEFVDKSIKELSQQAKYLQRTFWESFLESVMLSLSVNGRKIRNTADNLNVINSLAEIIDGDIRPNDGRDFLEWYVGQLNELGDLNQKYFGDTGKIKKFASDNRDRLLRLLGYSNGKIKNGSFLYTLIDFSDVYNQLKQKLIGAISTEYPFDLTGTKNFIIGPKKPADPLRVGAVEQQLNEKTFDSFQQYDRQLQKGIAEDLGMNYAIYQGGLIKTSREFCVIRNDKVFHKDEIAQFGTSADKYGGYKDKATGEFDGKSKPYNPFIDAGGWNCRHHYGWISDELAEELLKEDEHKPALDAD